MSEHNSVNHLGGRGGIFVAALTALLPTLAFAQAPPNDDCVNAVDLPNTFPFETGAMDAGTATTAAGEDMCAGSDRAVWYTFTPLETSVYRFSTCDAAGRNGTLEDTVVAVLEGASCGALTAMPGACNDDQGPLASAGGCGNGAGVSVAMTANQRYYIQLAAFSTVPGSTTMGLKMDKLGPAPANDVCAGALAISPTVPSTAPPTDAYSATTGADPTFSCATGTSSTSGSRGVWYTFTPTTTDTYQFDTCGSDPATQLQDAVISLYSASSCAGPFAELPGGACARSSACATGLTSYAQLVAGETYYVLVGYGNNNPPARGATQVAPRVRTLSEPSNDVCTGATPLTLGGVTSGTLFPASDDYGLDAGTPDGGIGSTATLAPGRDVVYSFTAASAGNYSFRVTATRALGNPVLYLANTCSAGGVLSEPFAYSNRASSTTMPEELACIPMTAGETLYAVVDEFAPTAGNSHDIEVLACFRENEPNDAPAAASALSCPVQGNVTPVSSTADADYYSLGTPAVDSRIFAVVDTSALSSGSISVPLRVTTCATNCANAATATGLTIDYDSGNNDTELGSSGSNLAGTKATGAQLYLQVRNTSTTTQYESYRLYSVVQPPSGSATVEAEPNDTALTANATEKSYYSGTIANAADADYFAFSATAGQRVYIGLDGDPDRISPAFNGHIQLFDEAGALLVESNDSSSTTSPTTGPTPGTTLTATTPSSPAEAIVYRIRKTGGYFVRVQSGSTSSTGVGPYLLSVALDCAPGRGFIAPGSATGFSPNQGSALGGTVVTVTGTGFMPGARVKFGANYAVNTTFVNDTTLIATTPAGNGSVGVSVEHPGYPGVVAPGQFTYIQPPAITSISPTSGPSAGGTAFTITGTEFNGANATVQFGAATPVNATIVSTTQLTGTTPAHAAGVVDVTVTTDFGSYTSTGAFTFMGPPQISSLTPPSGTTAGGTNVTINGTGFQPNAVVKFDGVTVTQNASATSTMLFVVTPAHLPGAVSVEIINPDSQQTTVAGAYTYISPPDLDAISPQTGMATGGETVTLTGTNFDSNARVFFGANEATVVSVTGGTTITATTPGGVPGFVNVTVRNADGQESTLVQGFRYLSNDPPPTATGLTPTSGPIAGGTVVDITGTNFQTGAEVTFGGVAATNVTVNGTGTGITATTPAHAFGPVTVVVSNPDFQSVTLTTQFTFVAPAPTLTAVQPISGPAASATSVTLTGTNFLSGATVAIGGAACTSVSVASSTSITCAAQPHAAGVVAVTVTNPDGKTATLPTGFEYIDAPVISQLMPNSGTTLGGTAVTITGSAFRAPVTVKFGAVNATNVTFVSSTQLQVTSPAQAAGPVPVTVLNGDGQSFTLPSPAFTYYAPPTVSAITPAEGYAAGGTNFTLAGTFIRPGATVRFVVNGTSVNALNIVTVANGTSLSGLTPPHQPGLADVVVTNSDGQSATLPNGFRFVPAPTLATISPNHGAATGGTRITVTGTNFQNGVNVSIGGAPVFGVVLTGSTSLTATTNAHVAGPADVTVTNPDGQSFTLVDGFTYEPAPSVTSLTPAFGPVAGGTLVVIEGSDFAQGATVSFGPNAAAVTAVTGTSLTVTSPAGLAGMVPVTVKNPDGQSVTVPSAFRYVTPPTLTAVSPNKGATTGGTRVTLTGTSLLAGSTVSFDGAMAPEATVLTSTSMEVVTPPHAAGTVDIVLTTPDGLSATLDGAYTFETVAPLLTQVAPGSGPTSGGTTITLSGEHFSTGATVKVGGVSATNVVVVSSTVIRAVTPSTALEGKVPVEVENADGQTARLEDAFEYVRSVPATEGTVADGGTGGVTGEGGEPDVIRPQPACGCSATQVPGLLLVAFAAFAFLRRRRSSPSSR